LNKYFFILPAFSDPDDFLLRQDNIILGEAAGKVLKL